MTRTIKTNSAYAALAYRKTVIHHLVYHLQRNCLPSEGLDAKETLVSEDVFSIDAEVPPEEIESFLEELIDQEEDIKLEMAKFEFTRKNHESEQRQSQSAQSQKGRRKKSRKGSGQGSGSTAPS